MPTLWYVLKSTISFSLPALDCHLRTRFLQSVARLIQSFDAQFNSRRRPQSSDWFPSVCWQDSDCGWKRRHRLLLLQWQMGCGRHSPGQLTLLLCPDYCCGHWNLPHCGLVLWRICRVLQKQQKIDSKLLCEFNSWFEALTLKASLWAIFCCLCKTLRIGHGSRLDILVLLGRLRKQRWINRKTLLHVKNVEENPGQGLIGQVDSRSANLLMLHSFF